MLKKISKFVLIIIFVFVVGGVGGFAIDRYFFPWLSSCSFFQKCGFLKKAEENVTVINKTEQVMVKEDDSINKIASRPATAVVNILSISKNNSAKKETRVLREFKNGTGVVIASDGLIVAWRGGILEENADYKIFDGDGTSYDAQLVGIDNFADLAYFKINISNLPVISFANSDDFRAGKKLVFIGNYSSEYQNSFSAGILEGVAKSFNISGEAISSSEKLEKVFLSDAGNVGDLAIDYNGELAGITGVAEKDNEKKYFQIPANEIKRSMELQMDGKLSQRAQLGVYYLSLNDSSSVALGLDRSKGALIYSVSGRQGMAVIAGSPAEKAGLKIGDIILSVGGEEINPDNALSQIISRHFKGEKTEFIIQRNRQEMKLEVGF